MDLLLATWDSMEELSTFGESEEIVAPLDMITPKSTILFSFHVRIIQWVVHEVNNPFKEAKRGKQTRVNNKVPSSPKCVCLCCGS
jgi:hypothetical protein